MLYLLSLYSSNLEASEHLINKELHSVLRQPLHLHQLPQIGAHERHHQVAAEDRKEASPHLHKTWSVL